MSEQSSGQSNLAACYEFMLYLRRLGVQTTLDIIREGSIMLTFASPGYRHEIEFFDNGDVLAESFASCGVLDIRNPFDLASKFL